MAIKLTTTITDKSSTEQKVPGWSA